MNAKEVASLSSSNKNILSTCQHIYKYTDFIIHFDTFPSNQTIQWLQKNSIKHEFPLWWQTRKHFRDNDPQPSSWDNRFQHWPWRQTRKPFRDNDLQPLS
jgi:hypothetical protein